MEAIRNAAAAAASYAGYGTENQHNNETETSNISGGEAPQHVGGNTQSGIEPVSGQLGRGAAGEPYDAGNEEGAAGLGGSSAQNPSSGYSSMSGGLTSGHGSSTNKTSSSEPLKERVESTFGIGGGDRESNLGGGERGPGFGTSSKDDASRLGSAVGHGSNPERYLYNEKNAPGRGGHRLDDDFTNANVRHEGASKLPAATGSDSAAGHSAHPSRGGLTSGSSTGTSNQPSGTGSSLARKAEEYIPGTTANKETSRSGKSSMGELGTGAGAAAGIASTLGYGRENERDTTGTTGTGLTSRTGESLTQKAERKVDEYAPATTGTSGNSAVGRSGASQGTGLTGTGNPDDYVSGTSQNTRLSGQRDAGLAGAGLTGAGVGGGQSGYTGSQTTGTGGAYTDLLDEGCDAAHEGYQAHGGHPIGEDAHRDDHGKDTFLDYRNDTSLPMGRAKPADK